MYVHKKSWKILALSTSLKIYCAVSPLTVFEPCTLFSSKSYNLHQTQTFVGHLLYTRRISDIVDITMSYIIYGFQDFANTVVSQRIFTYYRHRISSSPIHWEPDASILDEQQCDKCIIYAYRLFLDSWYLVLYKNSWSTH